MKYTSYLHMRNHKFKIKVCYEVNETLWKDESYLLLIFSTANRSLHRDKIYDVFSIR